MAVLTQNMLAFHLKVCKEQLKYVYRESKIISCSKISRSYSQASLKIHYWRTNNLENKDSAKITKRAYFGWSMGLVKYLKLVKGQNERGLKWGGIGGGATHPSANYGAMVTYDIKEFHWWYSFYILNHLRIRFGENPGWTCFQEPWTRIWRLI